MGPEPPWLGACFDEGAVPRSGATIPLARNRMIVVGTDFSKGSAGALMKARALADRLGDVVQIVHVRRMHPALDPWVPDEGARAWLEAVGETPEKIALLHGTPWVELARFAEERQAEVIVVGTHGDGGFHTLSIGTTATRLALVSPALTLLVGQHL